MAVTVAVLSQKPPVGHYVLSPHFISSDKAKSQRRFHPSWSITQIEFCRHLDCEAVLRFEEDARVPGVHPSGSAIIVSLRAVVYQGRCGPS